MSQAQQYAPTTPGQRDELLPVRWGAREVTLRSTDGGLEYFGDSGEPGLLLLVRLTPRGYVARLEDRAGGNSWASQPKIAPKIAVANLHREVKRLARAGSLGRGWKSPTGR